jgi:hypothetical protein
MLDRWPYGATGRVDVAGTYAYFNSGAVLQIADVSDPENPRLVGEIEFDEGIRDFAVGGGLVFVVPGFSVAGVGVASARLVVVDVNDPASPRWTGSLELDGWIDRVEASGRYAYVVNQYEGLWVVDAWNAARPEVVGFYEPPGGYPGATAPIASLTVTNGLAYLGLASSSPRKHRLSIVDLSSPASPVELGELEIDDWRTPYELAVSGRFAYAGSFSGLRVIDVGDPESPYEVGSLTNIGCPIHRMDAEDGLVYAATGDELKVFDAGDPAAPRYLAYGAADVGAWDVSVAGGRAYVAARAKGLQIVDVSAPSMPQVIGGIETSGHTANIAAYENFVYVSELRGLRVFHITAAGRPVEVRFVELAVSGSLLVEGDRLFVKHDEGVELLSLAQPARPRVQGTLPVRWVHGIAVDGPMLYLTFRTDGLRIYDVSSMSSPVEMGSLRGGSMWNVDADDGLVVTFDHYSHSDDFVLIDVSDPARPLEVGRHTEPDEVIVDEVKLEDGIVFLSVYSAESEVNELRTFDVRDPSRPVAIDRFAGSRLVGGWSNVLLEGRRVAWTNSPLRMWMLETGEQGSLELISDPIGAVLNGGVAAAGGFLYVEKGAGFEIYDFSQTCRAPRRPGGRVSRAVSP